MILFAKEKFGCNLARKRLTLLSFTYVNPNDALKRQM